MDIIFVLGLLASTIMLFQIRKISDAVGIVAFQALFLALIAGTMWWKTGGMHLLAIALLTLIVKGMLIPYILYFIVKKIGARREVERFTSQYVSLLVALFLTVVGYYVSFHLELPQVGQSSLFLSVSLILVLLGTFIMIDHKKAIMQGIGLITIENGIFLIAESIGYGMPLMVELGIFFDMLVSVVVIGILSFHIYSTFDSINTENMENLKG